LGQLRFATVVVGFSLEVEVEYMLYAELVGNMLFVEFAKTAGDWWWCNGMRKVRLCCLDGFVGTMKDMNVARGGIETAVFLAGEGYQ
jgi:hypothetical protein